MKGIIFNLLQDCVEAEHGDRAWDAILARSGVDGAFTSIGNYPDAQLLALVGAAAEELAKPADEIVRWFGRAAMPRLAERYPTLFANYTTSWSFLYALNGIIHPEVVKIYPGATPPVFDLSVLGDGRLRMEYQSSRRLCALAHGLVEGAADHFRERVSVEQTSCTKRGDASCVFALEFSAAKAGP